MQRLIRELLSQLGEDPDREGLSDTPARVARAYEDWFAGYREDPVKFLRRTFEEVESRKANPNVTLTQSRWQLR